MENLNCDDSYDVEFEKHENIKILPFVGEGYTESKPKIMVLGESPHWDKDGQLQETSRNNLMDYSDWVMENMESNSTPKNYKGLRNTAAMITGKGFKESDIKWYDMAFYNFYQSIIGVNSKDKTKYSPEIIFLSKKAFFDVIKILSPDFIIAWGVSDLYNWLPQEGRIFLDKEKKLYKYEAFPNTVIWHINHPSSSWQRFDLESWQEKYKAVKMFLN